jgi:hypothetical protein
MYKSLEKILKEAFEQASKGKGERRHGQGRDFSAQPIFWIEEHFKSFQLGQAAKKMHESQALPVEKAVAELLGAINFLAAHVIYLREKEER